MLRAVVQKERRGSLQADGVRTAAEWLVLNLVLLCSFHHRLVHEKGWSIRGNPEERVRFVRPDGRKMMMGPLQLRPAYRERLFRNSGPLAPVW